MKKESDHCDPIANIDEFVIEEYIAFRETIIALPNDLDLRNALKYNPLKRLYRFKELLQIPPEHFVDGTLLSLFGLSAECLFVGNWMKKISGRKNLFLFLCWLHPARRSKLKGLKWFLWQL